jgi:phosphoribosylanthranilate isomerase
MCAFGQRKQGAAMSANIPRFRSGDLQVAGLKRVPRVKFCGITTATDARAACAAGADALGLVFYPPSPRAVTPEQALEIVQVAQPLVSIVALFVNPQPAEVERVLARVSIDILQFHGEESRTFCEQFGRPYIKACRVQGPEALSQLRRDHPRARAYLCDTYCSDAVGGTGHVFDWQWLAEHDNRDVVLAGGLHADNVERAIATVKPGAVDVSSGIESTPGRKAEPAMQAFIAAVRRYSTQTVQTL